MKTNLKKEKQQLTMSVSEFCVNSNVINVLQWGCIQ